MQTITSKLQLIEACVEAKITLPPDINADDTWDDFPHFNLFCAVQVGCSLIHPRVHFDNAKIISELSADEASEISDKELRRRGFLFGDEK